MSTTRDISRRVGVCAARNRASAVRWRMPSSDPAGHASYWRTPASTTWYQWNPQSSRSSAWPSVAISAAGSPPALR